MRVHFIAIGGAAMHNLAIALKIKGFDVSGSDDQIFDPSKSRLEKYGLLPSEFGWHPEKIGRDLDAIILGMHAREDNPELKKAQDLGLKIYSYPEYIFEQSKDKTRVVIGGSHGKTSITSMILHVLNYHKTPNDYMVGAQLEGFECMVQLSDAPIIILEGDEYLSSPIDRRPKFHWYAPQIALLSGIAWDHINVFPTFENYVEQFQIFTEKIEKNGSLIFFQDDEHLRDLANSLSDVETIPYKEHAHSIRNGISYLHAEGDEYAIEIFGDHNLQNLNGARLVCEKLGLDAAQFYEAIAHFKGAARRLETIAKGEGYHIFKDFAHSPSKLKATTNAVKKQWPDRHLLACMELHTFSSLNADFLKEYERSMNAADTAIVYFNPAVVEHKKLAEISVDQVKEAFAKEDLIVMTATEDVRAHLEKHPLENSNVLLMTSGNFGGIDIDQFGKELTSKNGLSVT
ncbi:MAG: peptidoglycan synthetase [Flavobacteriales bacterium]|nr:peptidoglycan synthetase [Flavobacteriales bacterium]